MLCLLGLLRLLRLLRLLGLLGLPCLLGLLGWLAWLAWREYAPMKWVIVLVHGEPGEVPGGTRGPGQEGAQVGLGNRPERCNLTPS